MTTEQANLTLALHQFGVEAKTIELIQKKPNRQVWQVDAGARKYALKYVAKSSKAARIANVSAYFLNKGFPVLDIVPTLQGTPFVLHENGAFLLFQWKEGKHPRYTNAMIVRMAELLAQFHDTSRGYSATGGPMTNYRLDWTKIYKRKMKRLTYLRQCAESKGDSFSKLFLAQIPRFKARIKWALKRLPETSFNHILEQYKQEPLLGHGDYSRGNLLIDPDRRLFLMDFDTISTALPIRDISHLITSVNQGHGSWSDKRFRMIVDSYHKIRPVSQQEHELLLIDQVFPNKALRVAKQHFITGTNKSLVEALERCIAIDQQKLAALAIGPNE